jgi:hypothetical protein
MQVATTDARRITKQPKLPREEALRRTLGVRGQWKQRRQRREERGRDPPEERTAETASVEARDG